MYAAFRAALPRLASAARTRFSSSPLALSATATAAAAATVAATTTATISITTTPSSSPHSLTSPALSLAYADTASAPLTDWHAVVHALRETQRTHNLPSGFRATRRILPHTDGARWALTIDFPLSPGADTHAIIVALASALGRGHPAQLTVDDSPTQHRTLLTGPDDNFEVCLSIPRVPPLESKVSVRLQRGHSPVGDSFDPHEVNALVDAYRASQAPACDLHSSTGIIGLLDGTNSVDVGPPTRIERSPAQHNHSHNLIDGFSFVDPEEAAHADNMRTNSKRIAALAKLKELGVDVVEGETGLTWDALAGYTDVKQRIEDTLTLPLKHPEVYERIVKGTRQRAECNVPKAVLYEGPPGCGKTLSARILAATIGVPFVHVRVETILSKFYGETTRKLSEILEAADELGRCIVFLDECDGVGMRRSGTTEVHEVTRRTLSVLLRFIDGMDGARQAIVLAATNHKEDLDAALLSRFDVVVSFPLPDIETRVAMLRLYAKQLSEEEVRRVAKLTWGFSGRELLDICEEAERMRAGEIVRESGGNANEDPFSLPEVDEYVRAVERKADHVVGRYNERFASAEVVGKGLEAAAMAPAVTA